MLKPTPLRVISVVAVVGALLLVAIWQSGLMGQVCEKAAEQQNEHCATYNLAFVILIKLREFVDDNDGLITALATIVIAGFTAALWSSTRNLWLAGERQMTLIEANAAQQSIDMQASTRAAVRSADLAERSIAEAKAHSERELRAYVFPATSHLEFSETYEPIVVMEVRNFGKTPAYECTTWASIWVEAFPLPAHVTLIPAPRDLPMSKGSLAPGSHYGFSHKRDNLPVSVSEREMIQGGGAAIYTYGCINYIDCFGNPQSTKFKYFFRNAEASPARRGNLSQYMDGNEAT
ncbi:hypothetical protein [Mesorhizobium sp. B2-8-5]|uniref:hypothetical protein n=1 Tax=Mesorhizobium sp. B2-8-5 TaxID=2589903 RepID=UPI001126D972|nr:hypothetical protein [Mesorhizobium sp. B2-8-5]UCI24445.1 hypothetical protein FJ430_23010 [Mesorhizobium sp. B2-8-5]